MIISIVFAAGCFWGVEKHFEDLPGVKEVNSVYVGGSYDNPNYKTILRYKKINNGYYKNYAEGVIVKFDNEKTTSKKLIKEFWELHDPTQLNGQGNDIGNNYRSAVYYTNEKQLKIINETKEEYQKLLTKAGYKKIVTEIEPLGAYYFAEKYHQDYLAKNPKGYCPNHSTGVKFDQVTKKTEHVKQILKPVDGKEVVVVISENYCPYCDKFKKDVTSQYKGSLRLTNAYDYELSLYDIKNKLVVTPTILFIENGVEVKSFYGYMKKDEFYKELGKFKLGKNSDSYNVAFTAKTDGKFCKKYKIFKDTPDGVFVDKLSGDILFDTKDRFDSGTGWLSFKKSFGNAVIEKKDLSGGMVRTEIKSRKSGIHLGHVFDEYGYKRYCINATVMEFISREDIEKRQALELSKTEEEDKTKNKKGK